MINILGLCHVTNPLFRNGQLTEEVKLNLYKLVELAQPILKVILWITLHSNKKSLLQILSPLTVILEMRLQMTVKSLIGYQLQMLKSLELKSCLIFQEVSKELISHGNILLLNSKFNSLEEMECGKVLKKQIQLIWNIHLNSH